MENDLVKFLPQLAIAHWGEPNKLLSKGDELRFGTNGSKSVKIKEGIWYDHEENQGGGVIDFLKKHEPHININDRLKQLGVFSSRQRIWVYHDLDGKPSYEVVRTDEPSGKKYFQRQYGPNGHKIPNMKGVKPLPYNLPALVASDGPVFIVEGEKCADALIGLDLTATTNLGGARKWSSELNQYFKNREVIIIPDNDQVGQGHADLVAKNLYNIAESVKILHLQDLDTKGDVYDWLSAGGTKDKLLELVSLSAVYSEPDHATSEDSLPSPECSSKRIQLIDWDHLPENENKWLVEGIIPYGGLSALFGKPAAGKSFLALQIAAAVGSGIAFFENETEEGDVIYIAGEGSSGLKARCQAIKRHHKIKSPKVHFLTTQIDLRSTAQDRDEFIDEVRSKGISPKLVIIDTLSRAFGGGNENASEDMGKFIGHITTIQQALKTAVLIVHHSGKDEARGQRGHSSLNAAIDTELEVQKLSCAGSKDIEGQVTVTKQKDGEDGLKFFYKLEKVQLGFIDTSRSSLVVVPLSEATAQPESKPGGRRTKSFSGHKGTAHRALTQALSEAGEIILLPRIPNDRRCVKSGLWKQYFLSMSISDQLNPESKAKAFKIAVKDLQNDRTIDAWEDYVWLSDA